MDFLKHLMEVGNRMYLEELAEESFPYSEEDTEEDIRVIHDFREEFIATYHKKNNRQFTMTKTYLIPTYKQKMRKPPEPTLSMDSA
jgi:hypothetical protein